MMDYKNNFSVKVFIFTGLFISVFTSCVPERKIVQNNVLTIPVYPVNPPPTKILILRTCDASAQVSDDRSAGFLTTVLDSMLPEISREIHRRLDINSEIIFGKTGIENLAGIQKLIHDHEASHAISINSIRVFFEETDDPEKKDSTATTGVAFYDIVSEVEYSLYDKTGLHKDLKIVKRRFHSSAEAGNPPLPDLLNNKQSAFDISRFNLNKFLSKFFPSWELRARPIFTSERLNKVGEALQYRDYDAALAESRQYIYDNDKILSAKSNYNCAVLMEKKNRQTEAKSYLMQSLQECNLPEAIAMMEDYGL